MVICLIRLLNRNAVLFVQKKDVRLVAFPKYGIYIYTYID